MDGISLGRGFVTKLGDASIPTTCPGAVFCEQLLKWFATNVADFDPAKVPH
ncbi:MAG: hypothetical protein WCB27_01425 [Thermoguttaceae bacterium]|jgi:hypothetical protein